MKILTILIFSGDRLNVNNLLNDISKLNKKSFQVVIVEWCKKKEFLKKKKLIYSSFKDKIKNFKVIYQTGTWEYKYSKFIDKFNSKYILVLGDDDRLNLIHFNKIFKFLEKEYSGITLSFANIGEKQSLKQTNYKSSAIRPFNLFKDINRIGYTSCQIINVKFIKELTNLDKSYLLKTMFPQNFLILKIIQKYSNWKILELKCIWNQLAIFNNKWINKYLLLRLKYEYLGYFLPVKIYFSNLNSHQVKKIYKRVFFKNIISWIFLATKYHGKKKTFKMINNVRDTLKEPIEIKIFLYLFKITPLYLINILRIIRKNILNNDK